MGRATIHNNIVTDAKVAKVNKTNMRLLGEFIDYLRSTKHSDGTIKSYRSDLLIFFVFLLDYCNNKSVLNLKKRDVVALQNWLIYENNNSPARVRRIKASVSSLSNYVESILDDEYPDFRNIVGKIESPTLQPVREKSVFTSEELQGLLDALMEKGEVHKACALALAMASGRRKSELTRFRVVDFADRNIVYDSLYKTERPIKTKGRGDGKFVHCFTLVNKFKPYLEAWLKKREELGIESEWLLVDPARPENPIRISTLDSWAKQFSSFLGKPFYWHSMRHFWTTEMLRAGIPETVIASIISWNSVDMVSVYNDQSVEEQIGAYFEKGGVKKQNALNSAML